MPAPLPPIAGLPPADNSRKAFFREFKRVVELSDVVIQVLDARDPLACRWGGGGAPLRLQPLLPLQLQGWCRHQKDSVGLSSCWLVCVQQPARSALGVSALRG